MLQNGSHRTFFRVASDLCNKAGERQVAMFVCAVGEKVDDIFAIFKFSANDSKKCDIVLQKFEDHFIVKRTKSTKSQTHHGPHYCGNARSEVANKANDQ